MGMDGLQAPRKLRILCLHGFRTSGSIMDKQLSRWSPAIQELVELTCLDGPTLATGKSDVEGIFDGPYYEWFQFNKDYTRFFNYDKATTYVLEYMKTHGPFDGLLGFSQGSILAGNIALQQDQGLSITGGDLMCANPFKFVINIGGATLRDPAMKEVYKFDGEGSRPALFMIGEKDYLKYAVEDLTKCFRDKVILRHPQGHTIPRLDEEAVATVVKFLKRFVEDEHVMSHEEVVAALPSLA